MIFFHSTFSTLKKKYIGVISKILFCYFLIICSYISFSQCPLDIGETTIAPSDELLLYFPFDGDGNNLGDPRYSASVNGAKYVESSCGQGLDFDGEDDYVLVSPTLFLDQDYTVTAWINARDFADAMGIFSIREQCTSTYRGYSISQFNIGSFEIETLNNQVNRHVDCVGFSGGDRYADENLTLPVNEYLFVAITVKNNSFENRKVDLFVNCEKLETEMVLDFSTSVCFDSLLNYQTTIGASSSISGFESSFDGVIDELRVYNRSLTRQELLDIYRECEKLSIEVTRFTNCESDSAVIELLNTEQNIEYQLYDITRDTLLDSALLGNCGSLLFFTNSVDTVTSYSIIATDTASNCSNALDSIITLKPISGIEIQTERIVCKDEGVDFLGQTYYPGGPYETKIVVDSACDTVFQLMVFEENYDSLRVVGPHRLCADDGELKINGINSSNLNSSSWNTGDTGLQTRIVDPGIYIWEGESDRGCKYRVVKEVEECSNCEIAIPNIFSPNGDDINDVFRISSSCDLIGFQAEIYDRWGKLVFRSRDPKVIWDGRGAQPGVYVYHINYKVETLQGLIERTDYGTLTVMK